ncbi:MAG TPA: lysylphosphatidylglycerol synthase domain-containing protein [Coriobacteriia bacterium]
MPEAPITRAEDAPAGAAEPAPVPRWRRPLLVAARLALAVAIVYFVWRAVAGQLERSRFLELHFSFGYLAAAWAVLVVYYLLFAGGLMLVIRALGYRPVYRDVFKLSFAANLGKYLPGGLWQVAGKVAMARQAGVDRHAALVATTVETAVSVTGGLLLFLTTTLLGAPFPAGVSKWPLAGIMAGIFVALQPQIFARVVALGMRLLKIEGEPPHLRLGQIAGLVAYYAVVWLVPGSAFWLFTRSLTADPGANALAYAGFYAAAAVGGLLVLFVPAGLGVREGFLVLLMQGLVSGGAGTAWVVALAARVWSTLAELALSGVAVALPFSGRGEGFRGAAPPEAAPADPTHSPGAPGEGAGGEAP